MTSRRDRSTDAVRDRRDGSGEPTSTRVVRCVSVALDTPALDLPPLYEVVDPGTLDALAPADGSGGCRVTFSFVGTTVVVEETGEIRVRLDPDSEGDR